MSAADTPYIGSTISLISNAGIRYEGTLFCINTKESTVTLATVRSFGTENRPVEKQVAARPDVYEYIVFRGRDIKDLTVKKEPPKPQVQDPAIIKSAAVGSSPGLPPYSSPYQTPGVFSPFGGLPYSNYPVGYQPPQHFQQDARLPPMPPHMHGNIPQTSNLLPRNPTPPLPVPGLSRNSTPSPDLNQSDMKTQETQTKTTTQHATQTTKKKPPPRKSSADKTHEKENKNPEQPMQERNEEKPKQERKNDNKSRGGNRRGRRGGYRGPRKEPHPKEFQDDYDFVSANANFKKEEIEEELQKKLGLVSLNDEVEIEGEEHLAVQHPEPITYYNKESSFFDSISCEAQDREKNKRSHPSWQEERKLNTETFGTSGFRRGRGRGRGYYRGRGGGRGGFRGRGWRGGRGGRGSHRGGAQKDWVDYPLDADTSKLQQNLPSGNSASSNQTPVQA